MWTATKTDNKGLTNGQAYQEIVYTDGKDTCIEVERTKVITGDWPDAIARRRLEELNALDLSKLETGDIKPKPADKQPDPPTQDQLDLQAFQLLLRDWQEKKAVASETALFTCGGWGMNS